MRYDAERRQAAALAALFPLLHPRILEVGCGDGALAALLADHALGYRAIDPDSEAIQKARARGSRVVFDIGDGEALAFDSATFDVVIFPLSLHHQDGARALEEAHRVLTGEGRVLALEPDTGGELQQLFHLFNDETEALARARAALYAGPFHVRRHEVLAVSAVFEDASDLCAYPFDRTRFEAGDADRIRDKVRQFRDTWNASAPLQLWDILHLLELEKQG